LDTSHDGDISSKEFETLERVWRELQQSMYEFLGFAKVRAYRSAALMAARMGIHFPDNAKGSQIVVKTRLNE